MSKMELVEAARTARDYLLKVIEELSPEEIMQPSTIGKWSVKDVLSHIAGWDIWMSTTMQIIHEGKQPDLIAVKDFDPTNAQFVAERAEWPVEQILAEMAETYQKMLHFVAGVSEEQFFKPRMFEGQNWSLDGFLKTWDEHDRHHADKILLWWKTQKTE